MTTAALPFIPVAGFLRRAALYAAGGDPVHYKTSYLALPWAAQVYVGTVITIGGLAFVWFFPATIGDPTTFAALVLLSCLTSTWKVPLPLSPNSGCTLSVSYAADLMALMLLGPHEAMVVAVAGAWTQCTYKAKKPYPPYRAVFSIATEAITMQATGLVYIWLGGLPGTVNLMTLPKALVGGILTYFVANTCLMAPAIALSTHQRVWRVWHDNFLWSAPSFMVAGAAGAVAAMVVERGNHWLALVMAAPVYLTYRTYQVFLGRIEDQQRHVEETRQLHAETVEALLQARRAEQALAAETERLSVTLRSIGDGVISTDLNGTIVMINNIAERLTGWTQDEAVGRSFASVFCSSDIETRDPCDHSVAQIAQDPDTPAVQRCTILAARDLSERPIEEVAAPLRDASGRTIGMVVAFRDISDALKAQEERARAGKLASLGLLAGGIAHDFNNILMTIMGSLSMARVMIPVGNQAGASLAEAEKACVHARQLTWQLLTFSKGGVPTKKTIALPGLLQESARLALRGTHVTCTFDIDPDLWAVHADAAQLTQVFTNVLINAQQAMAQGGVVHIRATNIVEPVKRCECALPVEAGPYVRVSITDTGIGIPEENLGSIFDPYFSTKQRGSGLGLATSHSIVKHHGGFVAVDSKLGCGTTLHVNLPASLNAIVLDAPEWAILPNQGKGRILVMDDEPAVRTVAVNMLRYLGHEAEVADSGPAAIEKYARALRRGTPFDAVLLDLVVHGGMDGRETVERLTELDPAVNAIVISGYMQDSMLNEYRDYGFKGVIAKPFTLQELNTALHAVILPRGCQVH